MLPWQQQKGLTTFKGSQRSKAPSIRILNIFCFFQFGEDEAFRNQKYSSTVIQVFIPDAYFCSKSPFSGWEPELLSHASLQSKSVELKLRRHSLASSECNPAVMETVKLESVLTLKRKENDLKIVNTVIFQVFRINLTPPPQPCVI